MDAASEFHFSPRANEAARIAWRPWGEPAFAEARRLGRPVLLSLSAVWCHWCHVMDETSYSDERVIAALNEHYVPVRVDNDRHPDVNRRYNMGGWPTTVFLTPSGQIITGTTYMPPGQLHQALGRVREFFAANRASLLDVGPLDLEPEAPAPRDEPEDVTLKHIPEELVTEIVGAFDQLHGGIGTAPKFPLTDVFEFLLAFAAMRPEATEAPFSSEILVKTLAAMAHGGMHDHVGGGFFRYSTQRDWGEPHYEKMLEDNARLARLYLMAAGLARAGMADLGEPNPYEEAAESALRYLLDTLWCGDPPTFAGSQDADEQYYGSAAEEREAQAAPFIDRTVYVDWNALAARALLRGAALLGRDEWEERAFQVLDHIWRLGRREGHVVHYLTPDGDVGSGSPLLVDQAEVAAALLDAYEASGERLWLERAAELAAWVRENLAEADGRLGDRLPQEGDSAGLLARPVPSLDDNAAMADVLLRLTAYTGDEAHRQWALEILAAWVAVYQSYGVGAAPYGLALLREEEAPEHIVVVGGRGESAARRLLSAALAAPRPLRTVQLLDPLDDTDAARIAGTGLGGGTAAYVCRRRTCQAPIADGDALSRALAAPG